MKILVKFSCYNKVTYKSWREDVTMTISEGWDMATIESYIKACHESWMITVTGNRMGDIVGSVSFDPISTVEGLILKYEVRKKATGDLVENCFVLRPDIDKAARKALIAYAQATENEKLSADLRAWVEAIEEYYGEGGK